MSFKVVESCLIFFRKHGLILSEVFRYIERSKDFEKKGLISVQKVIFLRKFGCRNTFFLDIEKSNSRRLPSNDCKYKTIPDNSL